MNAGQVKAAVMAYWRYSRQCPIVTMETSPMLATYNNDGQADVMVMNKERQLIEVEVKISLDDLRRDYKKAVHRSLLAEYRKEMPAWHKKVPISYFYFAVPRDIGEAASHICDDRYPYAGLMVIKSHLLCRTPNVDVVRNPHRFAREKITALGMARLAFDQSATCCRLLFKNNCLEAKSDKV